MRYFFYARIRGVLYVDETGEDFESPEEACEAAHLVAAETARDYAKAGRPVNYAKDEIVVMDELGTVVATVPFQPPEGAPVGGPTTPWRRPVRSRPG